MPAALLPYGFLAVAHILSISSRVVRGTVGNTLASFALQRLGHDVWDVPTVIWDRHPGLGKPSGFSMTGEQIATLLADFQVPEQARRTAMIASGYFADADQIAVVRDHIQAVRAADQNTLYCCDPICGDAPGLYVPPDVLQGLRTQLLPLATFLTPNRHELGFLSEMPVSSNAEIVAAARALGRPVCLITSAFGASPDVVANLLVTPDDAWTCETPRLSAVPNGTGDLMTALFAGWVAHGITPEIALGRATSAVAHVLRETVKIGSRELAIVAAQDALSDFDAVAVRRWLGAGDA